MCGIVGSSSHTQGACRPLVNGLRPSPWSEKRAPGVLL